MRQPRKAPGSKTFVSSREVSFHFGEPNEWMGQSLSVLAHKIRRTRKDTSLRLVRHP